MKTRVYPAIVLTLLAAAVCLADDVVFGPSDIKVEDGKKVTAFQFSAKENQQATLMIVNGKDGKRARWVKVTLNGDKVAGRRQVNGDVSSYSLAVMLQEDNDMTVVASGKGASISIEIFLEGKVSFKKLIAVGDSLTAGYQDGSLVETFQQWGYAAQFAAQAGAEFVLPLISEPGIPPRLVYADGLVVPISDTPGFPINLGVPVNNLAVPGATVSDVIRTKSQGNINPFYDLVLGGKKPMLKVAVKAEPSFVILFIGNNDVLSMATETNPDFHSDLSSFEQDYETVLKKLLNTGAKIVAVNLPDATSIALLVHPPDPLTAVIPADALMSLVTVIELQTGQRTIESITEDDYLTPEEVKEIRSTIKEFNEVIENMAIKYKVPLVDSFALTTSFRKNGVKVSGVTLTTDFFGGLFGLDGVHPTNTTHAIFANELIDVLNTRYGMSLSEIDVGAVFDQDPHKPGGPAEELILTQADSSSFYQALKILYPDKYSRTDR